ncbi:O-acetyl-ADP-ribose deacetylase [uncultured Draconibacterium sp.]|uniref:O-acetyl-ADP-ribose deacetylase n=1 Tax=uncultured Draconibacterium sp. TaxID=1573823 RepID=UPI0032175843
MQKTELVKGDITKLKVDAIVNAANNSLLGGGGVDGAIHRAAGKELLAECRTLNGCDTGDAKITKAYLLPARFIIHTVGPVYNGGNHNEADKLASCYKRSLEIAESNKLETIAFPNISTGVYGYPKQAAAEIAIQTVQTYLSTSAIKKVVFCVFDEANYSIYKSLLEKI